VISSLGKNSTMRGRGLIGRLLFWLPKSLLGSRKETRAVSPEIEEDYCRIIDRLLNLPEPTNKEGQSSRYLIRLSSAALAARDAFASELEGELGPGGRFADMADWATKLPGQVVRLAGLFHCTYHDRPDESLIEEKVMVAAIRIAYVLAEHAKAALDLMGLEPSTECARKIWDWLDRDKVEIFTAREALEKVKGTFKTMREVNPGLEVLVEYGLIIRLGKERKSQPYRVNPKARGF
jgi:hypothetical protein